jgi:hypothetical protein
MDYFVEGKFINKDYTFCINKKCKRRKECARNLDKYNMNFKIGPVSVADYKCEEDKSNDTKGI